LLCSKNSMDLVLRGRIKSGLEKGCLYLSMPEYRAKIEKLVGFKPFKGTLNIEAEENKIEEFLCSLKPLEIKAFEKCNCEYSALTLYKVLFMGKEAAIIRPAKTEHSSKIIELISTEKLREKFKLKDNDIVEIGGLE